jgi:hypothetical protein
VFGPTGLEKVKDANQDPKQDKKTDQADDFDQCRHRFKNNS